MKKIYLLLLLLTSYLGAEAFNVTFSVDMQNVTGFTTPEVNGTFNGWCGNCNAMSDANADGIWEVTLDIPAGNYEYKFAHDAWTGQENLTPGSSCTMTTGANTNRTLVVTGATTVATVCWGSCTACNVLPTTYDVTFQVDMSLYAGNFTTPEVNGTFNGWCGNCNAMSDANGDDIWEVTVNLPAGNYEYKFAHDSWTGQENLTPGSSCTMTSFGNTNRTLSLTANTTVATVCWGSCTACNVLPTTYDVTFKVDMSQYAGNFNTPEVNGTFNGWCGNCNAMSDVNGDDIWEVTLNLPAGNYEYKFAHDAWTGQENLTPGSSCTMTTGANTNRVLSLSANTDLSPVCWGSCNACSTAPGCTDMNAVNYDPAAGTNNGSCLYATTFNVEMNCTDPFTNVYITGPWCGWCAAESYNLLTDANADGFYNVTLNLPAGNVEYKYMVDNWASQENLVDDVQNGGTCAPVTDGVNFANRQIVVGTTTNDTYGKCSTCSGIVLDPCDLLTLAFDDAGSLTSWSTVADATLPEASMTWDATGALRMSGSNTSTAIGKAYIFQYLNNAVNYNGNTTVQLEFDAKSVGPLVGTALHLLTEFPGTGVTNTFDIQNGGLNENTWTHYTYAFNNVTAASNFRMHFNMAAGAFLGAGGTLLVDNIELNCYTPVVIAGCTDPTALNYNAAATEDDGSCTYPVTYNVTFQVDMQNVTGFTTPEVNGTFNGWCGGCAPMTDANADGIWELTIPLSAGSYEFKYAYDAWGGQENLTEGSSCTVTNFGFTNRTLNVNADVTLPVVCWASCTSCDQAPVTYNVTFQVDMQNVAGFTTPEVNGTFNGWCGGCFTMSDANGDNIWEATTQIAAGTYEFKFAYDAWAGSEQLNPGDACTITDGAFTNRLLNVTADIVLPVVCWASCADCGGTATPVDVTFQVDMSQYVGSFTTPEVNGTFNNWCGGCAPMSDANGDNKWELTIPLVPGTYQYKFAFDSWAGQENLVPGSTCTITLDGFTNRVITAIDAETLPAVCWESCSACVNENNFYFAAGGKCQIFIISASAWINGVTSNVTFDNGFQTDTIDPFISQGAPIGGYFNTYGANTFDLLITINDEFGNPYATISGTVTGGVFTSTTQGEIPFPFTSSSHPTFYCGSVGNETATELTIFPNPTEGIVRINSNLAFPYLIEVFDLSGRKVQDMKVFQSNTEINLENLSKGAYQIRVSNNYNSVRETVIIN
jgi:1,4-alpha-glucan branching enzyme